MLIRDHWKKSWRMLLVSTLLVFMLNTMPAAATFVDYEDQVRWDLAVISETLELIYTSLETYLPDISELISCLEVSNDYLSEIQSYVNASVSQLLLSNSYLAKIESHLATIANGSGSSGSSSGTDLTEVLSWLETATGLIGHTQIGVDSVNAHLGVVTQYLYEISTKLDGVSTMVTVLNTASTYLSWISSDVEDVLESLETATGLIGTISLDTDALVTGMGVTQDLIAAANTNLTTMINKQELVFDYLADLSGDLGTVISKQNSVLSVLETVNQSLTSVTNRLIYDGGSLAYWSYRINHFLRNDFTTKLDAVLALMQEEGAFTTDISGVLADLDTMLQNQQNVVDALSDDGYIGDELHDIAVDTHQIYIKLGAFQEQQNTLVDTISKSLKHNNYSVAYYVWALGGLVERSFESVLANQSTALPVLQSMSESLTTISNRLYYVDASVSYYVWNISSQLRNNLPILIANQEATIVNQQKLIDLIEDLELTTNVTIENIENITIDVTNKAYEVFYITDSEGNEQNLADFSGDVLTITGRLLNFFFKVAFDDALDSVDSALNDMTEFYIDDSVLVGGGSLWE